MVELVHKKQHYAIIRPKVGTQLYFMPNRKENTMTKRTANYYTLGYVVSAPASHVSGSKVYQTVYVELFGGMRVSAIAGTQEISKGMYVGVRCTPKGNGETTYTVFGFNDAAQAMIKSAAAYIEAEEDDLLPF